MYVIKASWFKRSGLKCMIKWFADQCLIKKVLKGHLLSKSLLSRVLFLFVCLIISVRFFTSYITPPTGKPLIFIMHFFDQLFPTTLRLRKESSTVYNSLGNIILILKKNTTLFKFENIVSESYRFTLQPSDSVLLSCNHAFFYCSCYFFICISR